jgi:hypothetical protein
LTTIERALAHLDEAKEAYLEFQRAWAEVGQDVRLLNLFQWDRVDAYPGWDGTRDVGAGRSMPEWMEEVERALVDAHDPTEECRHCGEARVHPNHQLLPPTDAFHAFEEGDAS